MQSIVKPTSAEIKIKASKFLAYAFPIQDKQQAENLINKIRKEHSKANHHCYAYRLGEGDQEYFITNDDGEPKNSAAAPILGQIRSFRLSNVLLVVVRYFGGTKLGVGGLIKAYKEASKLALAKSKIIEVENYHSFQISVNHQTLGELISIIDRNNLKASFETLDNHTIIIITCKEKEKDNFERIFAKFT